MNTQMQEFFKRVGQDEELQAKLAGSGNTGRDDAMRTVVQVATETGYSFTEADLGSAVEAITGEMSPEQLGQVAGGFQVSDVDAAADIANLTGNQPLDRFIRGFFTDFDNR